MAAAEIRQKLVRRKIHGSARCAVIAFGAKTTKTARTTGGENRATSPEIFSDTVYRLYSSASHREKNVRKKDVQIGGIYRARVLGKCTVVKILAEYASGGWVARNLASGRKIMIRTAGRLKRRSFDDCQQSLFLR